MRRCGVIGIQVALVTAAVGVALVGCSGPHPTVTGTPVAAVASADPSSAAPIPTEAPWNTPQDSGPTDGATGSVRTDGSGTPVGYTVAAGDTQGAVCTRLGVRWWQLKGPDGAFLGTYPELQIGEKLTIVDVPESEALAAGQSDNNALC